MKPTTFDKLYQLAEHLFRAAGLSGRDLPVLVDYRGEGGGIMLNDGNCDEEVKPATLRTVASACLDWIGAVGGDTDAAVLAAAGCRALDEAEGFDLDGEVTP